MISKKTFVEVIKAIQKQDLVDENFSNALETVCDSWCIYGTINKKYDALFLLLKEIFNDENDWIGWWLYEDVKKVVTYTKPRKREVKLDTPEKLYKFLIENMQEKNENKH